VSQDLVDIHFQVSESSTSSGRIEYLPILCDDLTSSAAAAIAIGEASLLGTTRNLRRYGARFWTEICSSPAVGSQAIRLEANARVLQLHVSPVFRRLQPLLCIVSQHYRHLARSMMDTMMYGERLQTMVDATVAQIDAVAKLFMERNPAFNGTFQLVGHGFGACLIFDVLSHQEQAKAAAAQSVGDTVAAAATASVEAGGASASTSAPAAAVPPPTVDDTDDEDDAAASLPPPAAAAGAGIPDGVTVASLMSELEMDEFIEKFAEEDVDMEALLTCTGDDFKELGINMGKRKKIIAAVSNLGQVQQAEATAAHKAWEAAEADKVARKAERRLERRRIAAEDAERRLATAQATPKPVVEGESAGTDASALAPGRTGSQHVKYPVLNCNARNVFLFGAPVATFQALRTLDERQLGMNGRIASADGVMVRTFNVFHPYDALATRMEGLIAPAAYNSAPIQIPHHMGRKRLHLEFQGYLKQASKDLTSEVSKYANLAWSSIKGKVGGDESEGAQPVAVEAPAPEPVAVVDAFAMPEDSLNGGGRIDHVLQEDPLEVLNEKLMSMSTHSCYWTSRDTILFMLNSIYGMNAVGE
jgi:hypothetical protein